MMFYMNSRVFQNYFLTNEYDDDILATQYVIVSTRIRIRDRESFDNIIKATDDLFPNPEVCSVLDDITFRERYFEQLDESKTLLSFLIKGSIEEKYNIIFICSKDESKLKFLQLLSVYIYLEFGYPVYEYKLYCLGASKLIKYDKNKVLKKCNKIIGESSDKHIDNLLNSTEGHDEIHKTLKSMSKKSLIKEMKKRNLYNKKLNKREMIDLLEIDIIG